MDSVSAKFCSIDGCSGIRIAKGYCRKHYMREWRGEDPTVSTIYDLSQIEKFWIKVIKGGIFECWEWQGSLNQDGYGMFRFQNRTHSSHRVAYLLECGVIPEHFEVCHICDNRRCVNPAHLWLGTHSQNMQDMIIKGREKNNAPKGERSPNAKLTQNEVIEMRQMRDAGVTYKKLGILFGVHKGYAHLVCARKRWAHIP